MFMFDDVHARLMDARGISRDARSKKKPMFNRCTGRHIIVPAYSVALPSSAVLLFPLVAKIRVFQFSCNKTNLISGFPLLKKTPFRIPKNTQGIVFYFLSARIRIRESSAFPQLTRLGVICSLL